MIIVKDYIILGVSHFEMWLFILRYSNIYHAV